MHSYFAFDYWRQPIVKEPSHTIACIVLIAAFHPIVADVAEESHQCGIMSEETHRGNQVVPNLPVCNQSLVSNLSTFSQAPQSTIGSHRQPGGSSYRQPQKQQLSDRFYGHNRNTSNSGDSTMIGLARSPTKTLDLGFNQTPVESPGCHSQSCRSTKDSPMKQHRQHLNNNNNKSLMNRTVNNELDDTGGIQYSCADMSDLLATQMDSCSKLDTTDKDDVSMCTTTSGSYVVDPQDLCDEIDELFFKDMIV